MIENLHDERTKLQKKLGECQELNEMCKNAQDYAKVLKKKIVDLNIEK